jgi:hypothetical protein
LCCSPCTEALPPQPFWCSTVVSQRIPSP